MWTVVKTYFFLPPSFPLSLPPSLSPSLPPSLPPQRQLHPLPIHTHFHVPLLSLWPPSLLLHLVSSGLCTLSGSSSVTIAVSVQVYNMYETDVHVPTVVPS